MQNKPSNDQHKNIYYRLRRSDPHERLSARLRHFSFGAAVFFVVAAAGIVTHSLYNIQIKQGATFRQYAAQQQLLDSTIQATRGEIYDANGIQNAARLRQLGFGVRRRHCSDDPEEIAGQMKELLAECDAVITSGGVSVGQKDYLPAVLEQLNADILFAGVAQKPGSPMLAGKVGGKLVFCLSGNPFAAAATLEQYAVPALLRAAGTQIDATPRGYQLHPAARGCTGILACVHSTADQMREELYTVVDQGGVVVDVAVENPLYGELRGNLNLASRYDVDHFIQQAADTPECLLSRMTGGVHLHTLSCPTPEAFRRIEAALDAKGLLYKKEE